MKVAVVGGGPGGLLLASLLRRSGPGHEVQVFERNARDDTFGFGVVFSQETLDNLEEADPVAFSRVAARWRSWSAIDIHHRGRVTRSDGHQFAALARKDLLGVLADRALELGASVRFGAEVTDVEELSRAYDLVVGADGVNSRVRATRAGQLGPSVERGSCRYMWLGTTRPVEVFTFLFEETEHGWVQAHVYPYSEGLATFIVEMPASTFARAGLGDRPDEEGIAFAAQVFGEFLDGHPLLANNSRWLQFATVHNQVWHTGNVVLVGDAAHTAHFSVGSGTKLAMEDSIALAGALAMAGEGGDLQAALKEYEEQRQPVVASLQRAAATSMRWFEGVGRYARLPHEQFCFQVLTRSQRVTYGNLRLRDPAYVRDLDAWLAAQARSQGMEVAEGTPPMFFPFRLRGLELRNRVVVSPMAQYSCPSSGEDLGVPGQWHLVHLGSRAVGGAALVLTEMTCVSPEGRISPYCPGLWNDRQAAGFARIVSFVHGHTGAAVGLQLGHSGRKGSTRAMWEGEDLPLPSGNWEVMAPSPLAYRPENQVPREMTLADLRSVRDQFVAAARLGAGCGFDWLELHMAHGYLLSSFLSPLTNRRTDAYGGSLRGRSRFPLSVLSAVRSVWPDDRPLSVRISATDWVPGGFTGDDAVELAAMLVDHGCDIVDVSSGQVHPDQRPEYGRLYQTPFADRIRQEVGVPTMTVGAVSSVDDVNTIILAGRADLCLLARPHLVDPYWTLNAALDQGYEGPGVVWPVQYLSGKGARRREQAP